MTEAVPATTPVTTSSPTPVSASIVVPPPTVAPPTGAPAEAGATVLAGAAVPIVPVPGVLPPTASAHPVDGAPSPSYAPIVPERYTLALEGFSIDPALVQNADPVLRNLGLSNDDANKLMPVARDIMTRTQESLVRQIEDAAAVQKKEWHDAFVADPEIGGARRGETEHFAAKALDALGFRDGHPFRAALNATGFGNHPDMLRAFRRLGELVGEDGGLVRPMTASSRTQSVWERMYPNDGG